MEDELKTNILPFWINYAVDPSGGFMSTLTDDLVIRHEVRRRLRPDPLDLCGGLPPVWPARVPGHGAARLCLSDQPFWDRQDMGAFTGKSTPWGSP